MEDDDVWFCLDGICEGEDGIAPRGEALIDEDANDVEVCDDDDAGPRACACSQE